MKTWLKNNSLLILANIFIYVLPLALCLIMSFGGTKEPTPLSFKISVWGVVVALCYLITYYKKIKKVIERQKTIQIANLGYVKVWVRTIELFSHLLPYGIALAIICGLKGTYELIYKDLVLFIIIVMLSSVIGFIILCIDTTNKSK